MLCVCLSRSVDHSVCLPVSFCVAVCVCISQALWPYGCSVPERQFLHVCLGPWVCGGVSLCISILASLQRFCLTSDPAPVADH